MEIGLALPNMAPGWGRQTFLDWCEIADSGPFSSVSCGERIAFHNPEMLTSLAVAAALTERVRILSNLVVAPWHSTAMLAKQLATIDVVSDGRLEVALGVGAREQDFASLGASMEKRHQRLDDQVAELRRLWSGEPCVEGGPALGPSPVHPGGPRLLAGALGPRSLARAALWADGVTGFSLNADPGELRSAVGEASRAWHQAGRTTPRHVSACFAVCGHPDGAQRLALFVEAYFAVFGSDVAAATSKQASLNSEDALAAAIEAAGTSGCDELIVVPGDTSRRCAEAIARAVSRSVGEPHAH